MTWARGTITDHPGGKSREGVEVTCDATGCTEFELLGAHGGVAEKVQRLLIARGWESSDADYCPTHATPKESHR